MNIGIQHMGPCFPGCAHMAAFQGGSHGGGPWEGRHHRRARFRRCGHKHCSHRHHECRPSCHRQGRGAFSLDLGLRVGNFAFGLGIHT